MMLKMRLKRPITAMAPSKSRIRAKDATGKAGGTGFVGSTVKLFIVVKKLMKKKK
jgi:hypothetical protein